MMTQKLKLQARERLLAGSTYDDNNAPTQNMSLSADVDEDAREVLENQREGAAQGEKEAEQAGDPVAEDRFSELMNEMDTALGNPGDHALQANDTSDFPGMTVSDPSAGLTENRLNQSPPEGNMTLNAAVDLFDEGEQRELVLLKAGRYFTKSEALERFNDYKAEQEKIHGRPLTTADLIRISCGLEASTEDPISDGAAFDMLVDGTPEAEEPEVQKLTNDDGSTELPEDQALLKDDVPPGPPVLS